MLCEDCLKCVVLTFSDDVKQYHCEVLKIEIPSTMTHVMCSRYLPKKNLNKFSEEHSA